MTEWASSHRALFTSATEYWETPEELYKELDEEFHFTIDAAPFRFSDFDDGRPWSGRVFVKPPYGPGIHRWIWRAYMSVRHKKAEIVVLLLPARTDTIWFHDYVVPKANEIRFLRGRLHFSGSKNTAPFPSMLVIFRGLVP